MVAVDIDRDANQAWLENFRARASQLRVPLRGMLELTSRCNLRCVHCYLGSQDEQHAQREREMSTERVKSVLDEIAAAGCLFLTITGGDPMMRRDFAEIYTYARRKGMFVTVFCDAILVTDRILQLFDEYPPRLVEVSLYGATEATYERVTRVKGSHANALRGIRRLLEHGIELRLKTVLMSINKHEIGQMRRMAEELGVPFRFDPAIFPCLPRGDQRAGRDNDQSPIDLRVDPSDVVAIEMADPKTRRQWRQAAEAAAALPDSERLYTCGAGQTGFYIDPFANISPCLMTPMHRHSLLTAPFAERWEKDLVAVRQTRRRTGSTCARGGERGVCAGCPGSNYLETGDEQVESAYTQELTRLRYEAVMSAGEADT